jgi:hypothetical protein
MTVTSATLDVSIRAEVLNGVWETFGVDRDVEVMPETVSYEADSWGCLKASFALRRSPWAAWPDLSPFTPIEIEIGGVIVWIGRTEGTPLKAGAEAQINVQCGGWSQHLDDDLLKRVYVHSMLTDWKDLRTSPEAQLGNYTAAPRVQAETGVITLTQPTGTFVKPAQAFGVFLDLGEAAARKMVIQIGETNVVGGTDHKFYCRGAATVGAILVGPYEEGLTPFQIEGTSNTTHVATFATPHQYVGIFSFQAAGEGSIAADEYLKITAISVFSEEAYESGDTSVLTASTVIESVLPYAPLLSTDLSQIDTAADEFDIPSLVLSTPQTPRQVAEAVNAFHSWVLSVDLERRMVFAPPSSEPEWEIGSWSGETIEDASSNEAADIYDAVIVTGTAANGEALTVTVTAAELGPTTVVGERGFTRARTISLSNATDETVMAEIGRVWLEDQLEIPYGGAITAPVGAIRAVLGGQPQHPSLVCRHVNQLLRVSHAVDPSSGGIGRDGRIVSCQYNHSEQVAQITLGARTDSVQALLERLAVTGEAGS